MAPAPARRDSTATTLGQLRTITASMREGVIAYDMDLQLTFVNPAFERLTGYVAEDLRDQEFLQYVHPDDRPALLAEWPRLADGGSLRDQEYRVVTRAGQVRWCASAWEPLRDEAGLQVGYLGTEFDITERKLAETEMRLDTELFQAVIEVQQAVAAAGLDSATVMRVIAERSLALTGASGVVVELLEGDELVPHVTIGVESPRLRVDDSLSGAAVRTGDLQRSDDVATDPRIGHDAYREQGIRSLLAVPLRDDQRILGVLKVLSPEPAAFSDRDAKALRLLGGLVGASLEHAAAFEARQGRLEDRTHALQESEQRFKQLVDVAQEGIWVADDRGVITYVNQRMADLLGYQNGALLGRPVYDFLDATARAGAQRALGAPGTSGESLDLRFRRQDGTEVWGLVSASPIAGRDGAPVGMVGMVTDITERKRTEERLRRSAERLAVLHDLDQAILAARSPAEIGRAALGRMRRMVPCHRCSVVLFDFPRGQAQLIAGFAAGAPIPAGTLPMDQLSPGEVLRRGAVRAIDDLAAVESPAAILGSCAPRGCAACSASRCWWTARPSARSTSPRPPRAALPPSIATSPWRSRRRSPSPSSRRGCATSSGGRRASSSGAWPSGARRCGPPPPSSRRWCTPYPTICATRSATSAASPSSCSTTPVPRSIRPYSTTPAAFGTAPTGWPAWWTTWCTSPGSRGRTLSGARWTSPRWSRTW